MTVCKGAGDLFLWKEDGGDSYDTCAFTRQLVAQGNLKWRSRQEERMPVMDGEAEFHRAPPPGVPLR